MQLQYLYLKKFYRIQSFLLKLFSTFPLLQDPSCDLQIFQAIPHSLNPEGEEKKKEFCSMNLDLRYLDHYSN